MRRIQFAILSLMFCAFSSTHGRVGESYRAVVERYGRELRRFDAHTFAFRFHDFLIVIFFRDEVGSRFFERELVSDCESYHYDDEARPLKKNEVAALLKANGGDREWIEKDPAHFKTSDEALVAALSDLDRVLIVATKSFANSAKAKQAGKMGGF